MSPLGITFLIRESAIRPLNDMLSTGTLDLDITAGSIIL